MNFFQTWREIGTGTRRKHIAKPLKMDDGFNICALESLDVSPAKHKCDDEGKPFSVTSLMSNKLVLTSGDKSLPDSSSFPKIQTSKLALCLRRANSMIDQPKSSPEQAKPVSNFPDFTSPVSRASFKRPADPCSSQKELMKKPRKAIESPCPISKASIEKRMFCNADSQNLTADGSRQLLLPTVLGNANNRDLNNIDCHALAELINGRFDDEVASFRIIDARYEYEFAGGHIRGAENFGRWNEELFLDEFLPESIGQKLVDLTDKENLVEVKRKILIFHCEFSSVRGPTLLRWLRNMDRSLNKETYPTLHYPEIYLLHAGYQEFFQNYPGLCEPQGYVRMADPKFAKLERQFHRKSKTWTAGGSSSTLSKSKMPMKRGVSCEDSATTCSGKKSLFR